MGRDLLEKLWAINRDPVLTPSESFLPFAGKYGLKKEEFLNELSEKTSPTLKVLCPEGFFSDQFLDQISEAAKAVGTKIEFFQAKQAEFFSAFNDPKMAEKFDYILSIYAASERYPAVQLRYLTKALVTPPIDLKKAESPDAQVNRDEIFKNYERWLLKAAKRSPLF